MGMLKDISENGRGGSLGMVGLFACAFVLGVCTLFHFLVADDTLTPDGRDVGIVVREQADKIRDLQGGIVSSRKTLEERQHGDAIAVELNTRAQSLEDRVTAANATITGLKEEIKTAETDLASYQQAYRSRTRLAAAGEKLPSLTLKSGRRYQDVTINRVTAAGLEISHRDGLARVPSTELDDNWRRRFDWDDAGEP